MHLNTNKFVTRVQLYNLPPQTDQPIASDYGRMVHSQLVTKPQKKPLGVCLPGILTKVSNVTEKSVLICPLNARGILVS